MASQFVAVAILLWGLAGLERAAAAQTEAPRADPLPAVANLDGLYLALGPVASAVHSDDGWDGGFGGELMLVRVREQSPLAGLGIAAGGVRFAEAGNGRLWGDALIATKKLFGVGIGVSGGLAVEVGDLQAPRFGWQATLWGFAGVLPYIRVGAVEQSGTFVDAGIKLALPAIRWR